MADKLYLIRHGRTAFNKEGRLRAHTDVPLDYVGRRDVNQAGKKLAKIDPTIDCFYCSDLSRSKDTAHILMKNFDAELEVKPELRPWDLGSLAGQKVTAVLPLLNWYQDNPDKSVSRGESYNDFFQRWVKFLKHQIAETKAKDKPDAVVVHARHMLSLEKVLKAVVGEKVDTSSTPATGGPEPAAVVCINLKTLKAKQIIAGQDETAKIS